VPGQQQQVTKDNWVVRMMSILPQEEVLCSVMKYYPVDMIVIVTHRIPCYLADEAKILPQSDVFIQETMQQAPSLIPSNIPVQTGNQPRKTATKFRHGPTSLGGMNVLVHLETEQVVEHTKLMVSHLQKQEDEVDVCYKHPLNNCKFKWGPCGLS
jgi:hypothetical protein